jgi:leucyl aminopeptidase
MRITKKLFSFSIIAASFFQMAYANEVVVAPDCLTKKLTAPYQTLAKDHAFSLIQVDEKGLDQLIENKNNPRELCGGFMNVTPEWNDFKKSHSFSKISLNNFLKKYSQNTIAPLKTHYTIRHQRDVADLYNLLNPQNIWTKLTVFSDFHDRSSSCQHGVQAANWIKQQVEELKTFYHRNDITIVSIATPPQRYPFPDRPQPTILVKVGNDFSKAGIVVGAHMDTTRIYEDTWLFPGADDNGSGSMTVLETFRTILASQKTFDKPLYFIWYAAEEPGMLGSQAVVQYFRQNNLSAESAFNLDMTGYRYENNKTIYLVSDNTNPTLNSFVESLIKTYVQPEVGYTACGYACSDHVSWNSNGYPAVFPFEGYFAADGWHFNRYIHHPADKMELLTQEHMTNFAKIALAFVAETALPA